MQALAGVDLRPWLEGIAPGTPRRSPRSNVYQPSFFEGLGSLLVEERLEDWKAWLRFRIVHGAAAFLSDEFVDENFAFYGTQLTGVPVNRERWKRGVGLAEAAMGEAIGRVYVERHFPPASKAAMDELVANLIEAYRQSIAELEWMSPETRERALAKLDAFTPEDRLPGEVAGLLDARDRRRSTSSATSAARTSTSTTASSARSASRSIATSGT